MFRNNNDNLPGHINLLLSEAELDLFNADPTTYLLYTDPAIINNIDLSKVDSLNTKASLPFLRGHIHDINLLAIDNFSLQLFVQFIKNCSFDSLEKNVVYDLSEGIKIRFSHNVLIRRHPYKSKISCDVVLPKMVNGVATINDLVTISLENNHYKIKDSKYLIKNIPNIERLEEVANYAPYYLSHKKPVKGIGARIKRMEGLDVYQFAKRYITTSFSNEILIKIFRNLLYSVQLVHHSNIIHTDLHGGNIIIDPKTLNTNIIDFDDEETEVMFGSIRKESEIFDITMIIGGMQKLFCSKFTKYGNELDLKHLPETLPQETIEDSILKDKYNLDISTRNETDDKLDHLFCMIMINYFDKIEACNDGEDVQDINEEIQSNDKYLSASLAIKLFEKLILEYMIACDPQTEKAHCIATDAALKIMDAFSVYEEYRLSSIEDLDSLILKIMQSIAPLSDEAFSLLAQYADNLLPNIKDCETRDELLTSCTNIFDDYKKAYAKLERALKHGDKYAISLRHLILKCPIRLDAMMMITHKINKYLEPNVSKNAMSLYNKNFQRSNTIIEKGEKSNDRYMPY